MEELRPADEVIKELEIKPYSRLLFVGDVTYYGKEILQAAKSSIKPHARSLSVPMPLPANSADFVFVWLLGNISISALVAELTRICSDKGSIWVAMYNEEDIPLGMPGKNDVTGAMRQKKWRSNKEISLGKDYYAIRFQSK